MNLSAEYKLSLYNILAKLNESNKSEISLVLNTLDHKVYVKKVLKKYDINVFNKLKSMENKYIPKIYEVIEDEDEDELIIIEEYINGHTLEELLEKEGGLSEEIVIEYMIELCTVLNGIHSFNPPLIHRDIKPSNIIISNDGILKLFDFDVSRVYKENENKDTVILGTEGYAAPEQFGFKQTDCRSDLYAVGILINVLITGKHPIDEKVSGELRPIIEKCTEMSPDSRYQSAKDLRTDLKKLINVEEVEPQVIIKERIVEKIIEKPVYRTFEEPEKELGYEKNTKKKNIFDYIPGFRTRNVFKIIPAVLWYGFLAFGLTVYTEEFAWYKIYQNIWLVGFLLTYTLFFSNFLDIKHKLPFTKDKELINQIGGYILYTIIIFIVFTILGGLVL